MRIVVFHREADAEITEAARYYETKSAGLGFSFLVELRACLEYVAANPKASQLVGKEVRRKLFKRFPYSLLYTIEHDRIRVLAIAHHMRRLNYWQSRLTD